MAQWLRLAAGASCLGPTSERWVDSATDGSCQVQVYPSLSKFNLLLQDVSFMFVHVLSGLSGLSPAANGHQGA